MKIKNALGAFVAVVLVVNQNFAYSVLAQEFTVAGNGEGSSNNISYQNTNSDTISQENNADINNSVDASADTGNNQANGNSGEAGIETGDIEEEIIIINEGNASSAEIGCCPGDPSSASITDNGEDSENSIDVARDAANKINIVNELKLTNNVSVYSNTGDNEANDNGGDVIIKTGEINLLAQVLNQNLNSAEVTASNQEPSFKYSISGNGTGSVNSINENTNIQNEYSVFNTLFLVNNVNNYANTGGNKANKNLGNVFISTGSILLDIILSNQINSSKITASCCESDPPSPSPSPSGSPSPGPSDPPSLSPSPTPASSCCSPTTDIPGPGGGSGGPGGSGEVLGASLPATGGFSLWFLTGLALLMMACGVILRSDERIFSKFAYNLRVTALGVYLFANLKGISPAKT